MIEDIYDPAERYHAEFRDKFSKIAKETFEDLLKASNVDQEANKTTVATIRALEVELSGVNGHISFLTFWKVVFILLIVAGFIGAFINYPDAVWVSVSIAVAVLFIILQLAVIRPKLIVAKSEKDRIQAEIDKNRKIAWEQMAPLNRLFDWDVTVQMISKTIPRIEFDPFFTAGRLNELHTSFDWDDSYNEDKSVLFAHSGEINGNPFILGKTRYMKWEERTYTGSRLISYTVRVGKNYYHRTETLTASVTKPFPGYYNDTFLLYGNDAAPNLTFCRKTSGLANDEASFFGKWHKKRELSKLQKFSRNLKDESQYTMMSNQDFEVLFNTMNRNNEIEFRLLFTPIAQQQMVKLLRDSADGYGDDFSFDKAKKINIIQAKHLNELELDNDPSRYKSYSLESSRSEFICYNEKYFRAIYFAFAPLLALPLYQQMRTHENIYNSNANRKSCFWEHEALANFYGDSHFAHAGCATQCILKTLAHTNANGTTTLDVTAHGYRIEKRVDKVRVHGGDGRYHLVDVPWDEYLDVERTSPLQVAEDYKNFDEQIESAAARADYIQKQEISFAGSIYRRSMLSALRGCP